MNRTIKTNFSSLARKKNLAREKLYKVMNENEHEWQVTRKFLKSYEDQFVVLWEAYKTDRNFIEEKFFVCCDQLLHFIYQERKIDKEFKKIYKPYYNNFQKLNKEYNRLKLEQSKKQRKKNEMRKRLK